MKILLAPDKFKDSLTAEAVCRSMEDGIHEVDPTAEILSFPLSDGGDGFLDAIARYCFLELCTCPASDALGRAKSGSFLWDPLKKTAYVELASTCGLADLKLTERNPMNTSSYGCGLVIRSAIEKGATSIVLGLGGSASVDGGSGLLSGMGFIMKDEAGRIIEPKGQNLGRIISIEKPDNFKPIHFHLACDVSNPLLGPQGAALIFGPQKGANESDCALLESFMINWTSILGQFGWNRGNDKGMGAAGGIASGLSAFYETEFSLGIHILLDICGIKKQLPSCHMLFTGEGCIDNESFRGKVLGEVIGMVQQYAIPIGIICGTKKGNLPTLSPNIHLIELKKTEMDIQYSLLHASELLRCASRDMFLSML